MFTSQEVLLNLGYVVAQRRLLELVGGAWLSAASEEAFTAGHTEAVIGPLGGDFWPVKLARVRFLPSPPQEHITVVPLRWEAAGDGDDLVPVLDANIVLFPAERRARLVLSGSYRPPLGWYGASTDQGVADRVAATMISVLLRKLAQELCPEGRSVRWQSPFASASGNGDRSRPKGLS
jgi:hypothetical protein